MATTQEKLNMTKQAMQEAYNNLAETYAKKEMMGIEMPQAFSILGKALKELNEEGDKQPY